MQMSQGSFFFGTLKGPIFCSHRVKFSTLTIFNRPYCSLEGLTLQYLYENPVSNNFYENPVMIKISVILQT